MAKLTRNIPTKIPPDFVARTLRNLMPPVEVIQKATREQLIQLDTDKRNLTQLIKSDPSRFFQPNKGGQKAFMTWWDSVPNRVKKVLLFLAGNKTGKTTGGAILMGERLLGHALWDRKKRADLYYPTPAIGIVFTEDFESHRDTILPTIYSWWPKGSIKRIFYNNANSPSELELENGSVLRFKTYVQGSDTAEGKDWNRVWMDEPPPHSIYSAAYRGIVATDGDMYITATLLKEAWIADEIDQNYAQGFQSEIHDNEWIPDGAKEAFLSSLSDEEREVRESGKPFSLTGLIYKTFSDREPYVIPSFELPQNWPYFIGVDPHERRPVHVLFCTINPDDEIIFLDYGLFRGSLEEIFHQQRAKESEIGIPYPVRVAIMDPNRGAARQINKTSWQEEYEAAGYDVILGNDDLNIGHSKMWNYLTLDKTTGRPKMMFTEKCRGKFGPIWQMLRYAWDDWVGKSSRSDKDVKEKPKQWNKDFPDIARYVAMEELKFDYLKNGPKIIQTAPSNMRPYGRIR